MPPKAKVTREMIVDAAFAVARRSGEANINARTVAQELGCSTQPVMYHFARMEELKRAVYEKLDRFHTDYLMRSPPGEDELLSIGVNYIRFAVEEPHLFRFLFQSGFAVERDVLEMIDSPELLPVLSAMRAGMGLDMPRTREVFLTLALFAHGYASIIANNSLEFDEDTIKLHLERAFRGALAAAMEDEHEETV